MKPAACCIAAAVAVLCGCGAGRQEALSLGKVLTENRQEFSGGSATENDLVAATRGWAEGIVANGAGQGAQLEQNVAAADDLAKSAGLVSLQLGQLRKAVYDLSLQKEFTQGLRSALITEITRRQRTLQDLRSALTDSAGQLRLMGQTRAYKGESYPAAIDRLAQMTQGYKPPKDTVGDMLTTLKNEFGIKDVELVRQAAAR